MNNLLRAPIASLAILAILGGCSSSGGDSVTRTTGPGGPTGPGIGGVAFSEVSSAQVAAQRGPEYLAQRGLDTVGAAWLYARGAHNNGLDSASYGDGSGDGVTVGVIDDGLDNLHSEFVGRLHASSVLLYPHDPATSTASIVNPVHLDSPSDILTGISTYPIDPCSAASCSELEFCDQMCVVQFRDGSYMRLPLRPVPSSLDTATNTLTFSSQGDMYHGTRVTSIMAARRDGSGIHGLAYNADILFYAVDFGAPSPIPPPMVTPISTAESLSAFNNAFDPVFQLFVDERVSVINISLGLRVGAIDAVDADGMPVFTEQLLQDTMGDMVDALSQADLSAAERSIFVFAAGNDGLSSPGVVAGLPLHFDELLGHFMAVVSIDQEDARPGGVGSSGRIADFSNRCGVARQWCIAAPGASLNAALPIQHNDDGSLATVASDQPGGENVVVSSSGTSFSSPLVAGAIASLINFFNGRLANNEIVQRIFATANDDGVYADAAIYGHGLLDLKAATEPLGGQRVLSGRSLEGPASPLGASLLWSAPAVGDAWQRAAAGLALATFDELDAPFPVALGAVLPARYDAQTRALHRWRAFAERATAVADSQSYAGGHAVMQHLDGDADPRQWRWSAGMHPGYAAAAVAPDRLAERALAPWPALAQDGISLGLQRHLGRQRLALAAFYGRPQSFGAGPEQRLQPANGGMLLSWSPPAAGGTLELGWLAERGGFVGHLGTGALRTDGDSDTLFFGGRARGRLGAWQTLASAYLGSTDGGGRGDSLLRRSGRIISSSFSAAISRQSLLRRGDALALSLSQALRVESGSAQLRYAASRTRERLPVWRELHVDLEPSGRELAFDIEYSAPLGDGCSRMGAALGLVRDNGHGSTAERSLMASWRLCL